MAERLREKEETCWCLVLNHEVQSSCKYDNYFFQLMEDKQIVYKFYNSLLHYKRKWLVFPAWHLLIYSKGLSLNSEMFRQETTVSMQFNTYQISKDNSIFLSTQRQSYHTIQTNYMIKISKMGTFYNKHVLVQWK